VVKYSFALSTIANSDSTRIGPPSSTHQAIFWFRVMQPA
jgi:hypothetical protein